MGVLGGSWVVISGVIVRVTIVRMNFILRDIKPYLWVNSDGGCTCSRKDLPS